MHAAVNEKRGLIRLNKITGTRNGPGGPHKSNSHKSILPDAFDKTGQFS
jgi:hypothetical protein